MQIAMATTACGNFLKLNTQKNTLLFEKFVFQGAYVSEFFRRTPRVNLLWIETYPVRTVGHMVYLVMAGNLGKQDMAGDCTPVKSTRGPSHPPSWYSVHLGHLYPGQVHHCCYADVARSLLFPGFCQTLVHKNCSVCNSAFLDPLVDSPRVACNLIQEAVQPSPGRDFPWKLLGNYHT